MRKVTAIAVLALASSVAIALVGAHLRGRHLRWGRMVRRVSGGALLFAYAYVVLSQTLLGRSAHASRTAELGLLWSYRASLSFVGGTIGVENAPLLQQIALNVLLFVPLGALLPFVAPGAFDLPGARGALRVAGASLACSCAIELTQWWLRRGLFELDDLLDNCLGALVGFAVYRAVGWAVRRADRRRPG